MKNGTYFFTDQTIGGEYRCACAADMKKTFGCIGDCVIAVDVDVGIGATHHVAYGLAVFADDEPDSVAWYSDTYLVVVLRWWR